MPPINIGPDGSDGPQRPGFVRDYLARTVRAMETAGYTVEDARSVLSGNFARVFNVDVEPIAED